MAHHLFKPASVLLFFGVLCGCTATPSTAAPEAAASTTAMPVIDTIDGRRLESLTLHHPVSTDVVVFENGSRATIDKWGAVPERLAQRASVFVYNRPGYGNSEVATTARDGRTIVSELRRVLQQKGLKPPYVLVGHSLGGLYMQLFAKTHPGEVKALVLVDSLYPGVIKKTADFPLLTRIAGQMTFSRTVWREIDAIDDTGRLIQSLPGIDHLPIVQLLNQPVSSTAIAVDFGAFNQDQVTRDRVRALYPKATRIVADSSHQMALTSPELVAGAIEQVLGGPTTN